MNPSQYILLPDGRLRAGWRLLVFGMVYLAAGTIFAWFLSGLRGQGALAFAVAVRISAIVVATGIMMRVFERQPFAAVGLRLRSSAWRQTGAGLLAGMVLVGAAIAGEWAMGLVRFQNSGLLDAAIAGPVLSSTGLLVVAATSEEMLFRGYPFQRLVEGAGGLIAVAISAVIFGLLHALNPSATALSVTNTMLAGVLLSLAYLRTRALWFPIGIHFAWNWVMAFSGFPVSGLEIFAMPWRAVPISGALWLHGGAYGPEGGVVATVVLILGIAWLLLKKPRRIREA